MFDQTVFNYALALSGALGGWALKTVWDAVRDLQIADRALGDKVAMIEILVAGSYISKDDFHKTIATILVKLDRIEDKLDSKADK